MSRDAALAKIHIGKKELRLADDDYRALLKRVAGVDSAAALDDRAKVRVLVEFERLGWKPTFKADRRRSDKPGVRKIFALWADLARHGAVEHTGRPALFAFVKRQTGVDNPDWLSGHQQASVIEALKDMVARAKSKRVSS